MSAAAGKLLVQKIAQSAGNAGAKKAAAAAAQAAAKGLAPGMGELFKQELSAAAIPAAMSLMYYAPAYYDSNDPIGSVGKIAALTGTDLLGSAVLAAGARRASMAIRPGSTVRAVNPQYQEDLASLGLGLGASNQEIDAAKRQMLGKINAGSGDYAAKAAKAAEAKAFTDKLKNASYAFTDQYNPSRLSNIASYAANYGFTLGGMRAIEEGLINAGAIKPTWVQDYGANPGVVPQEQVIQQQGQNRVDAGVPNYAVTSPGTMSQMSVMEIQRLQNDLLAQAASEYEEMQGVI